MLLASRGGAIDLDKRTRWVSLHPSRKVKLGNLSVPIVPLGAAIAGSLALLAVRPTDATRLTVVFGFILLALSAAVVTGLSGQLVLGHVAYAGLGAFASVAITLRTGNFFLGFSAAAFVGAGAALVSSLPALRRRDLSLAVVSLAFAFACVSWAFPQTWMFGSPIEPGRPIIGSFALITAKSYAFFVLTVLCLGLYLVDLLWRSRVARRLVAQRDNPLAAASFGISTAVVRAQGLLIAGAIAGVAGALLAHATVSLNAGDFSLSGTLRALGGATLGGITSVTGSIWGTLFMVGLPAFMGGILGFIAAGWVGWLFVIVSSPGGIVAALPRRSRPKDKPVPAAIAMEAAAFPRTFMGSAPDSDRTTLELDDVSVTIGDLQVLEDVTLRVPASGIVGLVGRNGAGKSTLLDVISGQRRPDRGEVTFAGTSITHLGPERRARLGITRSFEGAILFPTLTLLETTLLALENPTAGAIVPRQDRRREAMAVIDWMGLGRIAHEKVGELSTGLRRMAQLACLAARRPRLLLLDEPASGIAQAELDGLSAALTTINTEQKTAMLIVEHELRVVRRIASTVIVLDQGRTVAKGSPDEVLGHHTVRG